MEQNGVQPPISRESLEEAPHMPSSLGIVRPQTTQETARQEPVKPMLQSVPEAPGEIMPLRTYQTDVEMYLKDQKGSLTKIAVAEQNKKSTRPLVDEPPQKPLSRGVLFVSAFLILGASGILGFFLFFRKPEAPPPPPFTYMPAIATDLQKELNITNHSRLTIMTTLENERDTTQIALGSVLSIYFTKGMGDTKTLVTPQELLHALGIVAPSELTRALTGNVTLGFHSSNGNQPFIILKVTDYQNGFAGMLSWEKNLRADLGDLFLSAPAAPTGTSTPIVRASKFIDVIVRNRDVRILTEGNSSLLYAFPDPTTIILTTNERTLEELNRRLIQNQIIR